MSDISFVKLNKVKYAVNDATPNAVFVSYPSEPELTESDYNAIAKLYEGGTPVIGIMGDGDGGKMVSVLTGYSSGYGFTFHWETISVGDQCHYRYEGYRARLKPSGEWDEYVKFIYDLEGTHIVNTTSGFTYAELSANFDACKRVLWYEYEASDWTGEKDYRGTRVWALDWLGCEEGDYSATFCSCGQYRQFYSNGEFDIMIEL